jgi:hypothetical protein
MVATPKPSIRQLIYFGLVIERRLRYLIRQGPRPCAFPSLDGGTAIVHRSTTMRSGWRVTWLDRDGEPWGHSERKDFAVAMRELRHDCNLFWEL